MTGTLAVDPVSLSAAGTSIAAVGDELQAALGTLTASYNANTGQDAAGTAFGFAYQGSTQALVEAVASGVNAIRRTGYMVQGSATNYSRAEAAADISGGATPLPAPAPPAEYPAPTGHPDVNGPGQAPPVLWYLVEFFVGDLWPNGNPGELRTAASSWRTFAAPLFHVTGDNAGPYATIGAQQIPERESMQATVRDIGTAMSAIAGDSQTLAGHLDHFATDVENTQNAVRDLLDKLKSVVSKGPVGMVFELLTGDAEEKIQEVAEDIKVVIANHQRQTRARKELIAKLEENIKIYSRGLQILIRREFVEVCGDGPGNVLANVNDAVQDVGVGLGLGALNAGGFLLTGIDPVGDPQGTWDNVTGFGKMVATLNPLTAPFMFVTDPKGTVDMLESVTHFDQIFTHDRPFIGVGQWGFDIATTVMPVGGVAKAGTVARGAEAAAEAGRVARAGERVAGRVSEITQATRNLGDVSRSVEGVTRSLDGDAKNPHLIDPPHAGRPVGTPHLPERVPGPVARDPAPPAAAHPPEGRTAPRSELPVDAPHGDVSTQVPVHGEVASAPTRPASLAPDTSVRTAAPDVPHVPEMPSAPAAPGGAATAQLPIIGAPHNVPESPGMAPHDAPVHHASQGVGPSSHSGPSHNGVQSHETDGVDDGHHRSDAKHDDGRAHVPPEGIPPLLERDTPYQTGGIDPDYVGEQYPGGPMDYPGVTYLDEANREKFRITIRDGLVYDAKGQLFDTSGGVSAFGAGHNGRAIFVMDRHGNLYASTHQEYGIFHHSSFFSGGEVAAAGELIVKDGRIELVTDQSGHYTPGRTRTQQFLDQLASQGIVIDPWNIELKAPPRS